MSQYLPYLLLLTLVIAACGFFVKNIKVSRTFSFLIIVIVSSVFLIPNIIASVKLYLVKKNVDQFSARLKTQQLELENSVNAALKSLHIRDENLMRCIRFQANIGLISLGRDGALRPTKALTSLSCIQQGVKSLEGIEDLEGLMSLDLTGNNITDISPLVRLTNLKFLSLRWNTVTDISPLQEMSSLEKVSLPDLSKMLCADLVSLVITSNFSYVPNNNNRINCIGDSVENAVISHINEKKKSGVKLTKKEKIRLLEMEINRQKEEFQRKHDTNAQL
jgi:Leucine-rich repeat (LRR) protein